MRRPRSSPAPPPAARRQAARPSSSSRWSCRCCCCCCSACSTSAIAPMRPRSSRARCTTRRAWRRSAASRMTQIDARVKTRLANFADPLDGHHRDVQLLRLHRRRPAREDRRRYRADRRLQCRRLLRGRQRQQRLRFGPRPRRHRRRGRHRPLPGDHHLSAHRAARQLPRLGQHADDHLRDGAAQPALCRPEHQQSPDQRRGERNGDIMLSAHSAARFAASLRDCRSGLALDRIRLRRCRSC